MAGSDLKRIDRAGVQMGVQTAGHGRAAGKWNVGRSRVLSGFL